MNLTQLDILLKHVVSARVDADAVMRAAKRAEKSLAAAQRQIEAAMAKEMMADADGDPGEQMVTAHRG